MLVSDFIQKDEKRFDLIIFKMFSHLAHYSFQITSVIDRETRIDGFSNIVDRFLHRRFQFNAGACQSDEVSSAIFGIRCDENEVIAFHPFQRIGKSGLLNIHMLMEFLLGDVVALPKIMKN